MARKSCEITRDGFIRIYPAVDGGMKRGLLDMAGMLKIFLRKVLGHKLQ